MKNKKKESSSESRGFSGCVEMIPHPPYATSASLSDSRGACLDNCDSSYGDPHHSSLAQNVNYYALRICIDVGRMAAIGDHATSAYDSCVFYVFRNSFVLIVFYF